MSDYSTLGEKETATLEQWYTFFEKRYNIVGKVSTGISTCISEVPELIEMLALQVVD